MNKDEIIKLFNKDVSPQEFKNIYETKIFPYIFDNFEVSKEQINTLILTVGFRYQPIVLSIKYFHPKNKIVLVMTQESLRKSYEKIKEFCEKMKLEDKIVVKIIKDFEKDIFKIIKSEFEENNKDPSTIVVDFTGGTKQMPAAAAIAAYCLKIRCAYIKSEYDSLKGMPKPFTEKVVFFNAPLDDYIDLFIEDFVKKINSYDFLYVYNELLSIKERSKISCPAFKEFFDLVCIFINIRKDVIRFLHRFSQNIKEGKFSILVGSSKKVILGKIIKILSTKALNNEFDYEFFIIRDLFLTYDGIKNQNLIFSYIYLQKVFEHLISYVLKDLRKENFDVISKEEYLEKFNEAYQSFFPTPVKSLYLNSPPDKITLRNGLAYIKMLREIFDDKDLDLFDLNLISNFSNTRNIIVHSNIEEERKQHERGFNEKEIMKPFKHALTLYNHFFNRDLEISDFDSLITIQS